MLPERIQRKIKVASDGCWLWAGTVTSNGYGRVWDGRRSDWVHRVVFRLERGDIPNGFHIDHLCRNTKCVRPDHLEAVTPAENARRSTNPQVTKARHKRRAHCKRGHPLFGENLYLNAKGSRACVICQRMHAAAHRSKVRQPSQVKKAVETPAGVFTSATDAARAHGISRSAGTWRARNAAFGWSYIDVLLELANDPVQS